MKPFRTIIILSSALLLTLLLVACPPPTENTRPVPNLQTYPPYPGINILDNVIYGVNENMQYSLHGNNEPDYIDCDAGVVHVTFEQDNDVWVRDATDPINAQHLGMVSNLGNYPDLAPSNKIGLTSSVVAPGESARILFKYYNIGASSADRSFTVSFYLSTDKNIEPGTDTCVTTITGTRTMSVGLDPELENYFFAVDFTIPGALTYGTYYLGYFLDSNSQVDELNEGNNVSPPEAVAEIYVTDTTTNSGGAFKVVNSWGVGGLWEKAADGHYWMTYQTVKALQLPCYYYYNDTANIYHPTAIAVFQVTHPQRNACRIVFGLGDPDNPVISKEFQPRYGDTMYGGALPFPANAMALDISEFVSMMNDSDLFMKITTASGAAAGSVGSFSVYFYDASSGTQIGGPMSGTSGAFTGDGVSTSFSITTTGSVPDTVVPPVARSIQSWLTTKPFLEVKPTPEELALDMAQVGVSVPGQNYAKVVDGLYGVGWAPPSQAEWDAMNKLVGIQTPVSASTPINDMVDHSVGQYFPPIGDQGTKGSCTAWSTAYYIHTFYMAMEHGWDFTDTTWQVGSAYGTPGYPSENRNRIFSPDFIYHQINQGGDYGSSAAVAMTELINMGCSPWEDMEYSQSTSTSWPSATAYTNAASYRASDMPTLYGNLQFGYFIIRTDADVNLLKTLLKNNYLVTCSIDADDSDSDAWWLYEEMDGNDVIDIGSVPTMHLNHAQTIVGFKDGTFWNPADPEN